MQNQNKVVHLSQQKQTTMKATTKKIANNTYQHIASGLYIVKCFGDSTAYWNIWKDADLTIEYNCGLRTKWQCIEFINNNF